MVDEVVLWCRAGTSDKIWGVADYKGRAITFWGKRNTELSFKLLNDSEFRKLDKVIAKKKRDNYMVSSFAALEEETPGFKSQFDQMLMMAILGDGFRHTSPDTIAGV